MAYGTNAPFGLKPHSSITGATWNDQTTEYLITSGYANNIFTGDPVLLLGTGGIGIGTAGNPVIGVFQGCQYTNTAGQLVDSPYWAASTTTFGGLPAKAFVADDPNLLFEIQINSDTGVALNELNLNGNFAIGTGSTRTGLSGATLDRASLAATATLNLKLLKLTPVLNNAFDQDYNTVLVVINNHILKGGTGTAGV